MILRGDSVPQIDFDGLYIVDYTTGIDSSSSLAQIRVPPGARHATSWSTRSDKYYYVLAGCIHFVLEDEETVLGLGDACIVAKGQRFAYENRSAAAVEMILFHTPSFDLEAERFETSDRDRAEDNPADCGKPLRL
jgi:mannose-6-phosphate isomerase-like protein (cupin superfamily)